MSKYKINNVYIYPSSLRIQKIDSIQSLDFKIRYSITRKSDNKILEYIINTNLLLSPSRKFKSIYDKTTLKLKNPFYVVSFENNEPTREYDSLIHYPIYDKSSNVFLGPFNKIDSCKYIIEDLKNKKLTPTILLNGTKRIHPIQLDLQSKNSFEGIVNNKSKFFLELNVNNNSTTNNVIKGYCSNTYGINKRIEGYIKIDSLIFMAIDTFGDTVGLFKGVSSSNPDSIDGYWFNNKDTFSLNLSKSSLSIDSLLKEKKQPHKIQYHNDDIFYSNKNLDFIPFELSNSVNISAENKVSITINSFSVINKDSTLRKSIQKELDHKIIGNARSYNDYLKNVHLEYENYNINCEISKKYSIYSQRKDYIVFELFVYNYSGGAHGMYSYSYLNYNVKEKKFETIYDIIEKDYVDVLQSILRAKVRKAFDRTEDWNNNYFTENVAILEDGLVFIYQPYEQGPFAQGAIRIQVKYEEIQSILK